MNIKPTRAEQRFIAGYFEAVEFTEESRELADSFMRAQTIDCLSFYGWARCYIREGKESQAGHDFWLTRNGHGSGFWDRDFTYYSPSVSDWLSKRAEQFGEVYVYYTDEEELGYE